MASFTAMKNLSRSPAEIKEDMPPPVGKALGPVYPYGLCICLDEETLEKLGIDGDLPAVGDMIHIQAMARVTCASQTEQSTTDGGKKVCRRIELQITDMAVEDEDDEGRPKGEKWYGGGEEAEEDAA